VSTGSSECYEQPRGAKKLLLVVDDNPSHIHVVHSILKDDYKLRIATSGAKALDLLPDLILLDVMMQDIDGYEVCGHLKANRRRRTSR
jgi:phosphoserine phosphatase RsbU/P